jgi:NAD(P)H dehydrogenase (quinone)
MGDGGRSYVTREDCARANAAALASDDTQCLILDITGPAAVGQAEVAAIDSDLTGKKIEYVRASLQEAEDDWVAGGLFRDFAHGLAEFDMMAQQGYHCMLSSAVEDLTGKPPESVRSYITRNKADLYPDEKGHARIDVHMARPTGS